HSTRGCGPVDGSGPPVAGAGPHHGRERGAEPGRVVRRGRVARLALSRRARFPGEAFPAGARLPWPARNAAPDPDHRAAGELLAGADRCMSATPPLIERRADKADVALLLEGTYPFVSGGVSSWVHQL